MNQGPPDIKSSALNHSTTLPPIDVCIGYLCGIVHLIQNLLIHFTTLKYPYSDIGGDIEESDSATASVITVCEESTMPVRVYAEVSSTGEGGRKQSLCSPSCPKPRYQKKPLVDRLTTCLGHGGAKQQTAGRWPLQPRNFQPEHDVGRRIRHSAAIVHPQR